MRECEIERLKTKNHQEAIIRNICQDFNMSPIIAKAHYEQMEKYFEEHLYSRLEAGQIIYIATSKEEPAGKPVKDCTKKAIVLTLHHAEDLDLLNKEGLNVCRRTKLRRIANEAQSQGAYLTCEDLAIILTTSVSTIKRAIRAFKKKEVLIPIRGRMKDIGRATSHKAKIVELFLENYQFTEIERMMRHSEKSIERYLKDFTQVALLTSRGLLVPEIRQVMGISKNLVQEYRTLYENARENKYQRRKLRGLLGSIEQPVKKNPRRNRRNEK